MIHPLHLRLDVLPPAQLALWPELRQIPAHFVLYGGTAIALRLGHRQSVDFDFFAFQELDHDRLLDELDLLRDARTLQKERNTLTVQIDRGGAVKVSFFGLPQLKMLRLPDRAPDNQLQIASLLDLAGTKASVVQVRAEAKDYLDLDAILQSTGIDLLQALGAAQALYGASFNPQITLKALSFFSDGNLAEVPAATRERLASAARTADLDRIPVFQFTAGP